MNKILKTLSRKFSNDDYWSEIYISGKRNIYPFLYKTG